MKDKIKIVKFSVTEIFKHARAFFFLFIIRSIITSTQVFLFAWLSKMLFNEIVVCISNATVSYNVLIISGVIIISEIILSIILKIIEFFSERSTLKYNTYISLKNSEKSSALKFEFFDNPKSKDELKQFIADSKAIINCFCVIVTFFSVFISFIVSLIIGLKFSILITSLSLLVSIPSFFIRKKIKNDGYELEKELNLSGRKIDYFRNIFSLKNFYQEVHVFDAINYFKDILSKEMKQRNDKRILYNIFKLKKELLILLFYSIVNFSINLLIIIRVITLKLSIGDYTYYNSIINNFKNNSNGLIENFNEGLLTIKKVENYYSFLYSKNEYKKDGEQINFDICKIEFRDVSFIYPNSKNYVLKNINFVINNKEKVAFAGLNGAGKTTIINLLLRFYEPTEGEIMLNNINIKNYKIEDYWKLFTPMFQHSNLYNITLRENLIISNIKNQHLYSATNLPFYLEDLEMSLPMDAFNKQVSKSFDKDGLIFSPGQAQKINIAKTLIRNAPIVILDEPSSAMDAISENKIMETVFNFSVNKMLIFISHRLSNLKMVDKIIFLINGEIVEIGSHNELMNNKLYYYQMFNAQSQKYI